MKLCLAILLVSFIFIEAHGSRAKRGLSADEQKKFLDELNKDREKVAQEEGIKFVPVKYDASLEKKVVNIKNCLETNGLLPLRYNDVAEEWRKQERDTDGSTEGDIYQRYFDPNYDRIGCSKETKCTAVLDNEHGSSKLQGKTIEYQGMCELGKDDPDAKSMRLKKAKTPSPNKYADILGIPEIEMSGGKQESGVEGSGMDGAAGEKGSGAGSAFSLLISLFMVLYI